eukprot:1148507-Pelagomonas_calceolata.AAC.3
MCDKRAAAQAGQEGSVAKPRLLLIGEHVTGSVTQSDLMHHGDHRQKCAGRPQRLTRGQCGAGMGAFLNPALMLDI